MRSLDLQTVTNRKRVDTRDRTCEMQAAFFQLFSSYVLLQLLEVRGEKLDVFLMQDQTWENIMHVFDLSLFCTMVIASKLVLSCGAIVFALAPFQKKSHLSFAPGPRGQQLRCN